MMFDEGFATILPVDTDILSPFDFSDIDEALQDFDTFINFPVLPFTK